MELRKHSSYVEPAAIRAASEMILDDSRCLCDFNQFIVKEILTLRENNFFFFGSGICCST